MHEPSPILSGIQILLEKETKISIPQCWRFCFGSDIVNLQERYPQMVAGICISNEHHIVRGSAVFNFRMPEIFKGYTEPFEKG